MARKRMIDPSLWADSKFAKLSPNAKVMFIGIFCNADDEGRLPGESAYLSSVIFPFEGFTVEKAKKIRDEVLSLMKSVVLYEVDGCEYIQLKKWHDYQVINKPTQSKYPPLREDYRSTTVGLPPNRIEENRIEENIYTNKKLEDSEIKQIATKNKVSTQTVLDYQTDFFLWKESNPKDKKIQSRTTKATVEAWIRRDIKSGKLSQKKSMEDKLREAGYEI